MHRRSLRPVAAALCLLLVLALCACGASAKEDDGFALSPLDRSRYESETAPARAVPDAEEETEEILSYVLNTHTLKFHRPDCAALSSMKEKNREDFTGSREELLARGYTPCGSCKP